MPSRPTPESGGGTDIRQSADNSDFSRIENTLQIASKFNALRAYNGSTVDTKAFKIA
jgi:hypothetical protein